MFGLCSRDTKYPPGRQRYSWVKVDQKCKHLFDKGTYVLTKMSSSKYLKNLTDDDMLRAGVIVGSPATVAARLPELQDRIGFGGILAELNCGGLIPHDRVVNALRLLCQEVKPRFR